MVIEYMLQESDLRTLAEYQILRSPAVARRTARFRLAYTLGFAIMAVGTYLAIRESVVALGFAVLALLSLLFYPPFIRHWLRASIPSLVRARMTESSIGHRRLRAHPDGLEQVSPTATSTVSWKVVGPVETGETHAFIPVDGVYSVVIPLADVPRVDFQLFVEQVAEHRLAAA